MYKLKLNKLDTLYLLLIKYINYIIFSIMILTTCSVVYVIEDIIFAAFSPLFSIGFFIFIIQHYINFGEEDTFLLGDNVKVKLITKFLLKKINYEERQEGNYKLIYSYVERVLGKSLYSIKTNEMEGRDY